MVTVTLNTAFRTFCSTYVPVSFIFKAGNVHHLPLFPSRCNNKKRRLPGSPVIWLSPQSPSPFSAQLQQDTHSPEAAAASPLGVHWNPRGLTSWWGLPEKSATCSSLSSQHRRMASGSRPGSQPPWHRWARRHCLSQWINI